MDNCLQHKKEVAGISDMKVLSEMIGDLHYESLAVLLNHISDKIWHDGKKDFDNGKTNLSAQLFQASVSLKKSSISIGKAYGISKKFMESNHIIN